MKDIADVRRETLDRLIGRHGERGRIKDFSDKHDLDPGRISQLLNGYRNIGESLARELEQSIGVPVGFLDDGHGKLTGQETMTLIELVSQDIKQLIECKHKVYGDLQKVIQDKIDERKAIREKLAGTA